MVTYEINTADIRHNIDVIKSQTGEMPLWGVIKLNGYSMGITVMAEALRDQGVSRLAVTDPEDVVTLRQEGFTQEDILLLTPPCDDESAEAALEAGAIFCLSSPETIARLTRASEKLQKPVRGHVKIDSGMGRFGFFPEEYSAVKALYETPGSVQIEGIFSHFSNAFSRNRGTEKQYAAFAQVVRRLRADGIAPGMVHISSSAAFYRYKFEQDAVRIGSALVGRTGVPDTGLTKIGSLVCPIAEIRTIPKGKEIGYGSSFKTSRDIKVAVVPMGRWHGVPENPTFPHRGIITVSIAGKTAKILGTVGAGHLVADITGCNIPQDALARMDINPLRLNNIVKRVYI